MIRYKDSGDIKIIEITKNTLENCEAELREVFEDLFKNHHNKIICDMQAVEYVDPGVMKAIIDTIKRAKDEGGNLKLCSVQPGLRRIFEFVGFDNSKTFYQSSEQVAKEFDRLEQYPLETPYYYEDFDEEEPISSTNEACEGDELYNPTVHMKESPLKEEDLYSPTIQKKDSPLKKQPSAEVYNATFSLEDSPLKKGEKELSEEEFLDDEDFFIDDDMDDEDDSFELEDIFDEDEEKSQN